MSVETKQTGEKILVGKIVGLFGVKGWVKLHSHTEPKENIFSYDSLFLKKKDGKETTLLEAELEDGKAHGKGIVVKFKQVEDRTQAESWLGTEIYITREQMQKLAANDFYWHDLIGCEVINEQEVQLGKVKKIMETGANDVLVLNPDNRLLPYVWEQVVKSVDVEQKLIRVAWPEEYFE